MDEAVKIKQRKFHDVSSVGGLFVMDSGYTNFRITECFARSRIIDTCCIHYILDGEGELFIGDRHFQVKAGQMFAMFKGDSCMYYPDHDNPWRYAWINIGGAEAARYLTVMGFSSDEPIRDCADITMREAQFTELFSQELSMGAAYYKAMAVFFDTVSECCNGILGDDCIKSSGVVERAKEIIRLNYDDPDFSVGLLDKIMHVSHSYICKLFKEQTNVTAANYLLSYRLDKAAESAAMHECTVKELCAKSGFSDELYFMKKFKERFGITVKEYMKRNCGIGR